MGSSQKHAGCQDKTPPVRNKAIRLHHELYFAKESSSWGAGGVAFVRAQMNPQAITLGRMYLITAAQFSEVVMQENDFNTLPTIDFAKAQMEGSLIFDETEWYGNLIHLGDHSGFPIFTFTSALDIFPFSKPAHYYLKTIARGIQETYPNLGVSGIVDYLITRSGISENYDSRDLKYIVETTPF